MNEWVELLKKFGRITITQDGKKVEWVFDRSAGKPVKQGRVKKDEKRTKR